MTGEKKSFAAYISLDLMANSIDNVLQHFFKAFAKYYALFGSYIKCVHTFSIIKAARAVAVGLKITHNCNNLFHINFLSSPCSVFLQHKTESKVSRNKSRARISLRFTTTTNPLITVRKKVLNAVSFDRH